MSGQFRCNLYTFAKYTLRFPHFDDPLSGHSVQISSLVQPVAGYSLYRYIGQILQPKGCDAFTVLVGSQLSGKYPLIYSNCLTAD